MFLFKVFIFFSVGRERGDLSEERTEGFIDQAAKPIVQVPTIT